jgi:hypothetical protein
MGRGGAGEGRETFWKRAEGREEFGGTWLIEESGKYMEYVFGGR